MTLGLCFFADGQVLLRRQWNRCANTQVFRTYNASVTLDRLLWSNEDGTPGDGIAEDGTVDAKKASYDRANKEVRHGAAAHCLGCGKAWSSTATDSAFAEKYPHPLLGLAAVKPNVNFLCRSRLLLEDQTSVSRPQVAILCNHQKAVGKGHDGAMEKLQEKLKDAKHQLKDLHTSGGCGLLIHASFAHTITAQVFCRAASSVGLPTLTLDLQVATLLLPYNRAASLAR